MHNLPRSIDVGISAADQSPGTWLDCETPVHYINWGARGGPVDLGTTCQATVCDVVVDVIVTAPVPRGSSPPQVVGRAYLTGHSGREEKCASHPILILKPEDHCEVSETMGILAFGQSDDAVCLGAMGGSARADLWVYCSAWMTGSRATCPSRAVASAAGGTSPEVECGSYPRAPKVSTRLRPEAPGEEPSPPITEPGGGKKPDCSKDDSSDPPRPGCVRVTVRIIPAPLPSDPENESIGLGVGTATLSPGGETVECLNPEDADACVLTADVPANTPASVSAQPGSLSDDPSSPPDSAFWKFEGACAGTGTCTFTPASGAIVNIYFVPAMVTLTLQASGDGGNANMTANEFEGGGLEPIGPVYCGYSYPSSPLPCNVMVRVEKFAQVEANAAGDPNILLDGFSDNCASSNSRPKLLPDPDDERPDRHRDVQQRRAWSDLAARV